MLARAFGADGEAKRERLLEVRAKLREAWVEGQDKDESEDMKGVARTETQAFLSDVYAHGV